VTNLSIRIGRVLQPPFRSINRRWSVVGGRWSFLRLVSVVGAGACRSFNHYFDPEARSGSRPPPDVVWINALVPITKGGSTWVDGWFLIVMIMGAVPPFLAVMCTGPIVLLFLRTEGQWPRKSIRPPIPVGQCSPGTGQGRSWAGRDVSREESRECSKQVDRGLESKAPVLSGDMAAYEWESWRSDNTKLPYCYAVPFPLTCYHSLMSIFLESSNGLFRFTRV
jgi:hypothetical protein